VLHPFRGDDLKLIQEAVAKAADAVEMWMKGADLGELMEKFNAKKKKPSPCAQNENKV